MMVEIWLEKVNGMLKRLPTSFMDIYYVESIED